MKIESMSLRNFRCFGPKKTKIELEKDVTAFVGGNGSGKTAIFQALSRLFGITVGQRTVRFRDFHLPLGKARLETGDTLSIEVILSFPELEGMEEDAIDDAVPEFFLQMAATSPGEPLKVRIKLKARWIDDGTPEGTVEEDIRWITTLTGKVEWDDCQKVIPAQRGSVQLIYVPASRDASTQVSSLLKGRLWQAAIWSRKFRKSSEKNASLIQKRFESERPAKFVLDKLEKRWSQVYEADTDTKPVFRLIENRFEELVRNAEFVFYPDEAGHERELANLSDGQRSLFHIALTAAMLEVEKENFALTPDECVFDQEKIRRTYLTILAIEEPENSLSPFFLSRIVLQAREIGELTSAQVVISSHSAAILSRIDPVEVRYCRLNQQDRETSVRKLTLPSDDTEANKYVRLAVRAYPELYFARFVILGEGDSERLVIPRIAEAKGIPFDSSFVPIVPVGGRHVSHFWKLLNDLKIPHVTLLDLDLGRIHGGANNIRIVLKTLGDIGNDFSQNPMVKNGDIKLAEIDTLKDDSLLNGFEENVWLQALQMEGVYFSDPIDLDFSMLMAFPEAYKHPHPDGKGPRGDKDSIKEKKSVTLKTGGNPDLYEDDFDDDFKWYPYLFLNRSKPETHLSALNRISKKDLAKNAPPELAALIKYVENVLALGGKRT